jgi:hypothetical protein
MYMAEWNEFTDLKLAEIRTLGDDPLTKHQWIRNMNGSVNNKVSGDIMKSLGITIWGLGFRNQELFGDTMNIYELRMNSDTQHDELHHVIMLNGLVVSW